MPHLPLRLPVFTVCLLAGGAAAFCQETRSTPTYRRLKAHLDYVGALIDRRRWLAGDDLSIADLAAAAHLSCLDYLGDVPWSDFTAVKGWYQRLKSRPSFRPLLSDSIRGIAPPAAYADLDF